MALPTFTVPTVGQPNSTEDVDIATALSNIYTILNGGIEAANITAATITAAKLASEASTTYTATVSSTSVTLGTGGTNVAKYIKHGRLVTAYGEIVLGTGGSFTGSDIRVALPFTASSAVAYHVGTAKADEAGVGGYGGQVLAAGNAAYMIFRFSKTAAVQVELGATSPFTWGDADALRWNITYEATS